MQYNIYHKKLLFGKIKYTVMIFYNEFCMHRCRNFCIRIKIGISYPRLIDLVNIRNTYILSLYRLCQLVFAWWIGFWSILMGIKQSCIWSWPWYCPDRVHGRDLGIVPAWMLHFWLSTDYKMPRWSSYLRGDVHNE